jgi:hypothetical protein
MTAWAVFSSAYRPFLGISSVDPGKQDGAQAGEFGPCDVGRFRIAHVNGFIRACAQLFQCQLEDALMGLGHSGLVREGQMSEKRKEPVC